MLGAPPKVVNACTLPDVKAHNSESGRSSWIAVLVLAVLAVGLAIAMRQSGILKDAPSRVTSRASGTPDPGDRVIQQALKQTARAVPDSVAIKHRWLDDVRGVDVSGLDSRRHELFLRFANARECTCGCGYSLAGCKGSDMTCEVSGSALAALIDSIRAGRITSARGIRARPRNGG